MKINRLSRIILTFAILFSTTSVSFGQSPNWIWAKNSGGAYNDEGRNIASDLAGNIYVTGVFRSPSITFGSTILTNSDTSATFGLNQEIFLVKYDPAGNVIWAKTISGFNQDWSYGITTDSSNSVYITGIFMSDTIAFDSILLTNSGSGGDMFIAKYNSSGNIVWAKNAKGNSSDIGYSLAIDANQDLYVAGCFYGDSIRFNSTLLLNTTSSSNDIFIAKYDLNGNFVWARQAGGAGNDIAYSITCNSLNEVFITGSFSGNSSTFGTCTITNTTTTGYTDYFIAKYNSSGIPIWAKSAGGGDNFHDSGYGVSTDSNGNSYVIAEFCSASITVGGFVLNNISSTGNNNIFIAKYDSLGTVLWAKSLGVSQNHGFGVSVDLSGNSYLISDFGNFSITLGSSTLVNNGGYDIFVAKFDTFGNPIWAKSVGGNSWDYGNAICMNSSGEIYITGSYYNSGISFGGTTLSNVGESDICVAKLAGISTGIDLGGMDNQINIFPNPTSGQITISSLDNFEELTITDVLGQTIFQKKTNVKDISLNLDKTGIYFIKIKFDRQINTKKIIVQH